VSLGKFRLPGWVRIRVTCVGTGTLEIDSTVGYSHSDAGPTRCQNSWRKPTLDIGTNIGAGVGLARIGIRATATVQWRVVITKSRLK